MSLVDEIMTALMKIAQQTGEGPAEVALPTMSYLQLAFELGAVDPDGTLRVFHDQPTFDLLSRGATGKSARSELIRIGDSFQFNGPCGAVVIREAPDGVTGLVSGHVAAAMAFDLGREKFRTEVQLRPLIDHLLESGGEVSQISHELANAAGIMGKAYVPFSQRLGSVSTGDLIAECERRGLRLVPTGQNETSMAYDNWRSVLVGDPPMSVPASMPGLQSALHPGETFGSYGRAVCVRCRTEAPTMAVGTSTGADWVCADCAARQMRDGPPPRTDAELARDPAVLRWMGEVAERVGEAVGVPVAVRPRYVSRQELVALETDALRRAWAAPNPSAEYADMREPAIDYGEVIDYGSVPRPPDSRPEHLTHAFVPRFSGGRRCNLCQEPRQHALHRT